MESNKVIKKNIFLKKRLFIISAIFIFLGLLAFGADAALDNIYQDKFLPNVKISGIEIGGLTAEEARTKLDKRIDFVNRRGFVYISPVKTVTINPSVSALDSTESLDLIVSWNVDKSLLKVNSWQSNENLFGKLLTFVNEKDFFKLVNIINEGKSTDLVRNVLKINKIENFFYLQKDITL